MNFLTYRTLFIALASLQFIFSHPVIERDGSHTHLTAHVPVSVGLKTSLGITPKVIVLDPADLLEEGTVVPGSPDSDLDPNLTTLQSRDVIGADDRFLVTQIGKPWDHIGRLELSGGARCSGSLVGPRHLATARHCFDKKNVATYTFRPNYDQGSRGYTAAQVSHVMYVPGELTNICSFDSDWAVMILNQRIGEKYGYFGVKQLDGTKADPSIFWHEGYPIDRGNTERPYVQQIINENITSICPSGPIKTHADSAGGQSGGPLWSLSEADGVRYLYGVDSAASVTEVPQKRITAFAGGIAFVNAVAQARQRFP